MTEPGEASTTPSELDLESRTDSGVQSGMHIEQVGQFLLSKNLHLTALELLVESEEIGLGHEVCLLRDFFHDKNKFNPEKLAQFQGEDVLSAQALAKEREEKLGLAEYDLRLAQEDIKDLKERLERAAVQASASPVAQPDIEPAGLDNDRDTSTTNFPGPSPRELQYMNGGVLAHLLHHGYRVTAMTLQEEAQGQIDSSSVSGKSDVGGLPLWKHYRSSLMEKKAKEVAEAALKEQAEQFERLNDFQRRYRAMQEKFEATYRENQMLRSDLQVLEEKLEAKISERKVDTPPVVPPAIKEAPTRNETSPDDRVPPGTPDTSDIRTPPTVDDGFGVFGAEAALRVVSSALPKVVPNVLINKREELVPVIIALVQEHPVSSERDKLCNLLFNLVKRPNKGQRQVIAGGCVVLAKAVGARRTAEELLPQCWEQVSHKYPERRTLVAEVMGLLVDHIAEDMRCSLVVSILEQLCGAGELEVRQAALTSLTRVLDLMSGLEKYRVFENLMINLATDPSEAISGAAMKNMLPAMLNWIWDSDKLYSELMPNILQRLLTALTESPFSVGTDHTLIVRGEAELHTPKEAQQRKMLALIYLYCKLLPVLRTMALKGRPDWAVADGVESRAIAEGPGDHCSNGSISSAHNDNHLPNKTRPNGTNPFIRSPSTPPSSSPENRADTNPFHASEGGPMRTESNLTSHSRTSSVLRLDTSPFVDPLSALTEPEAEPEPANPSPHTPVENNTPQPAPSSTEDTTPLASVSEPIAATHSGVSAGGFDYVNDDGIGDAFSELEASELFGCWVEASDHGDWTAVEMVASRIIPLLVSCIRKVGPVHECKKLRRRLVAAVKLTCGVFGDVFTARAVEPQFVASAGIPAVPSGIPVPDHVAKLAQSLMPTTAEASRVGRACVFPALLAGVLPQAGKGRVTAYVRSLLSETGRGETWVIQHKKESLAALQFAGLFSEGSSQLLGLLRDSVKSPTAVVKRGGAILAEALVMTSLPQETVQTILPSLEVLTSFYDKNVQVAAVEAMESVAVHCSSHPEVVEKLHAQFDKLVTDGSHEVQMAVIRALSGAVNISAGVHVEFLLKQVLLLLAHIHQKSSAGKSYLQLQEMALTIFHALRTLDGCEIADHSTRLHLVAAMESLKRESQLLDPTQRQLISAMLKDLSERTPALQVPQMAQRPMTARHVQGSDGGSDSKLSYQGGNGHRRATSLDTMSASAAHRRSDSESSKNSGRPGDPSTNPFT
ncbi:hypothetical protein BSKO_02248 [Bryopsis sp. KO-2023]|nr:hypothetical protein BSKO_02248 [Bryopsis sp. KO-2023]